MESFLGDGVRSAGCEDGGGQNGGQTGGGTPPAVFFTGVSVGFGAVISAPIQLREAATTAAMIVFFMVFSPISRDSRSLKSIEINGGKQD
jgi:hypothetical protein